MKSILVESVAVFILATTKTFTGRENQQVSSYDSRMIEIAETWAKPFEHVYFVMGSNKFDNHFLKKDCSYKTSFGDESYVEDGRRRLLARAPQTETTNRTDEYICDYTDRLSHMIIENTTLSEEDRRWRSFHQESHQMNVLFVGNCTGEYFGIGPACRYQETARYFLSHAGMRNYKQGAIAKPHIGKFKDVEWFLFIDDDLYIRPYSLMSMLKTLPQSHPHISHVTRMKAGPLYQRCEGGTRAEGPGGDARGVICVDYPVAILAPLTMRSFLFSKRWDQHTYDCTGPKMNLHIAMPALINKEAMALMRSAVDANGMTELQAIWGGTHDMLLATWLYMYKIPLYSMRNVYHGTLIETMSKEGLDWAKFDQSRIIFVHMLKNFAVPVMANKQRTDKFKLIPGMVDVARAFGDDAIYKHMVGMSKGKRAMGIKGKEKGEEGEGNGEHLLRRRWKEKYNEQISRGKVASRTHLTVLQKSRVDETAFAEHTATLHETYVPFKQEHCPLRSRANK